MDEKNISKIIDNINKELGKDESVGTQLIAFRAEKEVFKKVKALESIGEDSRTDVMIRSINTSYNGIIFEHIINKLMPKIKKIFKEAKLKQVGFGSNKDILGDSDPFRFGFDEGIIIFDLPGYKFKSKNKDTFYLLNTLMMKLKIEGLKKIKIESILPVVGGHIDNISSSLFRDIHKIAAKNSVQVRSMTQKKHLTLDFRHETNIYLKEEWLEDYGSKVLILFKKALEEIGKELSLKKETKFND